MENKLLFAYDAFDIANKNNKMLKSILRSIEEYAKLGEYYVNFSCNHIDSNINAALKSLGYRVEPSLVEQGLIKISWGK